MRLALVLVSIATMTATALADTPLPPVSGPNAPKVVARQADDGLFHQSWEVASFLDLREDFAEAKAAGRRFAVVFEQRGCIYCRNMHTEVLAQRYITDYVRENFAVLQFDLFGAREVTDFDGKKLSEAKLAERWGVMFTPTVVFLKDDLPADKTAWGAPLEVTRMSLGFGPATFYELFVWMRTKVYEHDRNFQRFHVARMAERMNKGTAAD